MSAKALLSLNPTPPDQNAFTCLPKYACIADYTILNRPTLIMMSFQGNLLQQTFRVVNTRRLGLVKVLGQEGLSLHCYV